MITENLSTLKIHKMTQEQYNRELEAGRIDESALYLTPDKGSTSWNDIKDRPFGESDNAELLPITQFSFDSSLGVFFTPGNIDFVEGKSYTVNWNGTDYTTVGVPGQFNGENLVMIGNPAALGGANNGLPFAIACLMGSIGAIPLDGSTHIYVGIRGYELKKIPEKYLPDLEFIVTITGNDSDGYTADKTYDEVIKAHESGRPVVVESDEPYLITRVPLIQISRLTGLEGVEFSEGPLTIVLRPDNSVEIKVKDTQVTTPDMAASEGEDGHILNRTHYTKSYEEVVIIPETTATSNSGGRISLSTSSFFPMTPLVEGDKCILTCNGVDYPCTVNTLMNDSGRVSVVLGYNDNDSVSYCDAPISITFLYRLVSSASCSQWGRSAISLSFKAKLPDTSFTFSVRKIVEDVKKIDNKYISSEWTATSEVGCVIPEVMFTPAENEDLCGSDTRTNVWSPSDSTEYSRFTDYISTSGLPETLCVVFDGKKFYVDMTKTGVDNEIPVWGNAQFYKDCQIESVLPGSGGIPFALAYINNIPHVFVGAFNDENGTITSSSHTIAVYIVNSNKIPDRFLSDDILKKTNFVSRYAETVVIPEITSTGTDFSTNCTLSSLVLDGENYVVNFNGVEYECTARSATDSTGPYIVLGFEGDIKDRGVPFLFYFRSSSNDLTDTTISNWSVSAGWSASGNTDSTVSIKKIDEEIRKIDNKFIDADWIAKTKHYLIQPKVEVTLTAQSSSSNWTPEGVGHVLAGTSVAPDWDYFVRKMGDSSSEYMPRLKNAMIYVVWDDVPYLVKPIVCSTNVMGNGVLWGNGSLCKKFSTSTPLASASECPFALSYSGLVTSIEGAAGTHTVEIYLVEADTLPDYFMPEYTVDHVTMRSTTVGSTKKLQLTSNDTDVQLTDLDTNETVTLANKSYVDDSVENNADWVARDRVNWSVNFEGSVTLDDTGTGTFSLSKLSSGNTYTVIIDDIEFTAKVTGSGNVVSPYKITNPNDSSCYVTDAAMGTANDKIVCPSKAGQTVNVKVGIRNAELTILPEQHIPSTVPVIKSATVGQVIAVKAVDENGRPTEWESMNYTVIPEITEADNGKVLMVVDGKLQLVNLNLAIDENGVVST